jgi:hypothetical protein
MTNPNNHIEDHNIFWHHVLQPLGNFSHTMHLGAFQKNTKKLNFQSVNKKLCQNTYGIKIGRSRYCWNAYGKYSSPMETKFGRKKAFFSYKLLK